MRATDELMLGKAETIYATDPNPGVADVLWCREIDETVIESDEEEEANLQPEFGSRPVQVFAHRRGINMTVPVVGASVLGTALPDGYLLKACGMSEDLQVATAAYQPAKLSTDSAALRRHKGGNLINMLGCRGSWVLSLTARKILERKYSFKGLHSPVVQSAIPAGDFSGWQKPIPLLPVAGASFSLHGFAAALEAMEIDLGNEFDYEGRVGNEGIEINGRQMKGSVTIEAVDETTKGFIAACESGVEGVMNVVIVGSGVGTQRQVTINCPQVQLMNPKYVVIGNKKQGLQMDMVIIPTAAGDDEYVETWAAVA